MIGTVGPHWLVCDGLIADQTCGLSDLTDEGKLGQMVIRWCWNAACLSSVYEVNMALASYLQCWM